MSFAVILFIFFYTSSPTTLNQKFCFDKVEFTKMLGVKAVKTLRCYKQFCTNYACVPRGIFIIATQTRYLLVPIKYFYVWLKIENMTESTPPLSISQ